MAKFYLNNAIAYVNGAPHIGHALEMIQGDALARYHRLQGDDVRFQIGTDEHGTKMAQTAKAEGVTPQELADRNAAKFLELHQLYNVQFDNFIRTSSEIHKRGAQKLWKKLEEAGVLYEKEYEGLYCTGCEAFYLEKDLVNGNCPNHLRPPELIKEKNIFFRLSDFGDRIKEKILNGEFVIRPESRKNEILALIEEGLSDVSFSRPKASLTWGIDVPGREDQVMYVWCDALANYITGLGYADDGEDMRYWPTDVNLVGKDITRFHCAIWPAMLMAAGLPINRAVFAHGFITSEGQKMSKSLGNVVDPLEVIKEWGVEPVRYYLLREVPTGDDGDFSRERFLVVYGELQHIFGNLMRRVMAMTVKYFEGNIPAGDSSLEELVKAAWAKYHDNMQNFNIRMAIEAVVELAREANAVVEREKPWELAKTDTARLGLVLGNLLGLCRELGKMLQPFIPETSQKILEQITDDRVEMGEALFPPIEPSIQ